MADHLPYGPQVDLQEDLYRAITQPKWWVSDAAPPRPRAAAFGFGCFSANIASLMPLHAAVEQLTTVLRCPNGGIVSFQCGVAIALGFDPRKEPDEEFPENKAHANVYQPSGSSDRKRRAQRLAEKCRVVHLASFPDADSE